MKNERYGRRNRGLKWGSVLLILAISVVAGVRTSASAQTVSDNGADLDSGYRFEVATIKPANPDVESVGGFYSYPGGRVYIGLATLKTLMNYAFGVQVPLITGGPDWANTEYYNVEALWPEVHGTKGDGHSGMRHSPTAIEMKMLQNLLIDRFDLKVRRTSKESAVYLLSRGNGPLHLADAQDKQISPKVAIFIRDDGVPSGAVRGSNASIRLLAKELEVYLDHPVLDQTGLAGSYDLNIPSSNSTDADSASAVEDAMSRLGLKLKTGRGSVDGFVILNADRPGAN